jgi:hypothetical protein
MKLSVTRFRSDNVIRLLARCQAIKRDRNFLTLGCKRAGSVELRIHKFIGESCSIRFYGGKTKRRTYSRRGLSWVRRIALTTFIVPEQGGWVSFVQGHDDRLASSLSDRCSISRWRVYYLFHIPTVRVNSSPRCERERCKQTRLKLSHQIHLQVEVPNCDLMQNG